MGGLLDWVDPTRNAFQGLLRGEDREGIRNKLVEALMASPKPFDRSVSDEQMLDNAMNFGPGAIAKVTKNSLAKLARAMEKEAFETGRPASAIGFHGSPDPNLKFDLSKPAFLSSHPEIADSYTAQRGMWRTLPGEGATIYPSKVEFKNPLVVDAFGKQFDNIPNPWVDWQPKVFGNLPKKALSVSDLADIAKAQGHDGLIVKNVIDGAERDIRKKSTVYAALIPESFRGLFSKGE